MNCIIKKKNKKGWIRIVEAFVAILIIAGIVLIVIGRDQSQREDSSSATYTSMVAIIREIQLNNTLRGEILGTSGVIEWEGFDSAAPQTKAKIIEKTPAYLECVGKICATNDVCLLANSQVKNIYSEDAIISSTLQTYNPRILKLFCWSR